MLKVRKIIFCLFFLSIYINANAITLDEALISAYKNNQELKAQRESLKASDENIMQALAGWLPDVNLQSKKQYDKTQAPSTSFDGTVHSLTISQNLFRSGADIANMKVARSLIEAARATLKNLEQEVFIKAIKI